MALGGRDKIPRDRGRGLGTFASFVRVTFNDIFLQDAASHVEATALRASSYRSSRIVWVTFEDRLFGRMPTDETIVGEP